MKKIAIVVESNTSGNAYHYINAAKQQGCFCYYLTRDINLWILARYNPVDVADKIAIANTIDVIDMFNALECDFKNIVSVVWFDEIRMLPCFLLGVALGVFTSDLSGVFFQLRYKDKVRGVLNESSHPIKYAVFDRGGEFNVEFFSGDCVVKPVDESGSFGVKKCHDQAEMMAAINDIKELGLHISGYKRVQRVLIEEYIGGEEFSAEFGWCPVAGWILIGYTKKIKSEEPYFVEIAHVFPYRFSDALSERIYQVIVRSLDALGLKQCFAHVEFKIFEDNVFIVEINPRLPGDMIVELVKRSSNIDLAQICHFSHALIPWGENFVNKNSRYAAVAYFYPEHKGVVESVKIDIDPSLFWLKSLPRVSSGYLASSDDRLGCIIQVADTFDDALSLATSCAKKVIFNYG